MEELKVEDHLKNILFGLQKSTMSWEDHENVKASFNAIAEMLLKDNSKKEEGQ